MKAQDFQKVLAVSLLGSELVWKVWRVLKFRIKDKKSVNFYHNTRICFAASLFYRNLKTFIQTPFCNLFLFQGLCVDDAQGQRRLGIELLDVAKCSHLDVAMLDIAKC